MFNHHRGLWGYTGAAPDGEPLTIQATGMGGPSAAIVLTELIALGARRAIRVGTCGALDRRARAGRARDRARGDLRRRHLARARRAASASPPTARSPSALREQRARGAGRARSSASTCSTSAGRRARRPRARWPSRWRPRRCSPLGARAAVPVGCVLAVSDTFDAGRRAHAHRRPALLAAAERMGAAAIAALVALSGGPGARLRLCRGARRGSPATAPRRLSPRSRLCARFGRAPGLALARLCRPACFGALWRLRAAAPAARLFAAARRARARRPRRRPRSRRRRGRRSACSSLSVRLRSCGLDRRQARLHAARRERAVEPVDAVLDALQAVRDRAQPPGQPFDVGGRGDVQRAHRHLLGLGGLLARVERAADRAGEQRVFEQLGERLAEPLLGVAAEPLAQALGDVARRRTSSAPGRRVRRGPRPPRWLAAARPGGRIR